MKEYMPTSLREGCSKLPSKFTRTMYAIGEEKGPNEFAMWNGPTNKEKKMLETVGRSNKSCIVKFMDNPDEPNTMMKTIVAWRWQDDRWINVVLTPQVGDKDSCKDCGKRIKWNGNHWEHVGLTPRHVAVPTFYRQP